MRRTKPTRPSPPKTPAPPAFAPAGPRLIPAPKLSPEHLKQKQLYDEAVRLFQGQKYDRAEAILQKVIQGPDRALAHHAQVHIQICRQRLAPQQVNLKTADDYYNYAVTLINARQLEKAAQHLEKALTMAPRAGHIHYALAAARALQGNAQAAYERLKTAIDLEPRNRYLARGDADFAGILGYPPLVSLLRLDRGPAPKSP
jgi:tetratricopeptide (TPR) repeat protein